MLEKLLRTADPQDGEWLGHEGMARIIGKVVAGAVLFAAAALVGHPSIAASAQPGPPPTEPPAAISLAPEAPKYRLGPDDTVRVIVYDEPQMTGQFIVSATGSISLPLIGQVPAKGLTVDEVGASIIAALKNGYIKEPSVSVEVVIFRPFYILGEVNKPGEYPFQNGLTVMNAVATAGGFTYRANEKMIFIRQQEQAKEERTRLTTSTQVHPGDTIRIAERHF
jgi:polysaccharide export outer membrane protein